MGLRETIPAVGHQKFLTGLIGAPIAHSASPAMHGQAADALGIRCHYQLIEVAGAGLAELRALLASIKRIGFVGVNVTFPYKEAVVPLLDELSERAAAIGTVNTVVARDGRLTGHNTDSTGFAAAFASVLGNPGDKPIVLVGAGGVGRAIAFALAALGARALHIVDADSRKAEALSARLEARMAVRVFGDVRAALDGAGGVINGTPVGMPPNRDTPVPANLLHAGMFVVDAVYTPLWTPLLLAARAAGCRVMTGRDLAIDQAVDAFRLFTGFEPSREPIAAAFDGVIAKRDAAK